MARFPDHFSAVAREYARFRPRYPDALFDWIAAESPARDVAWDCGTGSGQAALGLAPRFRRVVATDPSGEQLAAADRHPVVDYVQSRAEATPLAEGSVDVVTVATALHWFDLPAFYGEVERILRPRGLLVAWSYGLFSVSPAVDAVLRRFTEEEVGADWPAERVHVDRGYRDLPFPYPELACPVVELEERWSVAEVVGYLSTWSAVQRHRTRTGRDPMPPVERELAAAWGDPTLRRPVRWPLAVRAGRRA